MVICTLGCISEKDGDVLLEDYLATVQERHAPDKRVALFDVTVKNSDNGYILKGESNLPDAIQSLRDTLTSEGIKFIDSIQRLPRTAMAGKMGIIKNSVANLRGNPAHSSELVTQATLGTPVILLKKVDNWYYIQTPDKYLSWVDSGGIQIISDTEFETWQCADKIIYLKPFGQSYQQGTKNSGMVTDLVAGDILELLEETSNFYKVLYPDGKSAFIDKTEAQMYRDWVTTLKADENELVRTSMSLLGLPYLWGGTSTKGVDCSGFTKTVFFLNGLVIPRDASQQVHTGKFIDSTKNFNNLREGDLLFFGRKATDSTSEKVVHVGMWIGNDEFIHSAGDVHVSSINTNAENFDEYNLGRYLRSKRLWGVGKKDLMQLSDRTVFMKNCDDAEE